MKLLPRARLVRGLFNLYVQEACPKSKKLDALPRLLAYRGTANARTWLVTPPPTQEECESSIPFSNPAAAHCHSLFKEHGFDTETDSLVLSCCPLGLRPSKQGTTLALNFLTAAHRHQLFDRLICIGGAAFKYMLGEGRGYSMDALRGQVLFVPLLDFAPVLVLPDIDNLVHIEVEDRRLNYRLMKQWETNVAQFDTLLKRSLETFLNTYAPSHTA